MIEDKVESGEVTKQDILAVCQAITGKRQASVKGLSTKLGWDKERVSSVLDKMFAEDLLGSAFGNGTRYSINAEHVETYIDENKNLVVKRTKLAAPIAGIAPKAKKPSKGKKLSNAESLDALLGEIAQMPKKSVLEGAEREARIAEAFGKMCDIIEKLNQGLEALDRVSDHIKFSRKQATIQRILPETDDGLGGIVIHYREFTLKGTWDRDLTQSWLDRKVESVAAWTRDKLAHAVSMAKRVG